MRYFFPCLVALLIPLSSGAATDDAIEKATNPLHLSTSVALQDYYTPELYGSDRHTNDTLFRMTTPVAANDLVPVPQILRMTVPLATRPQPGGGYATGLGDINLFDIFLLKQDGIKLGILVAQNKLEEARAAYRTALEKMDETNPGRQLVQLKLDAIGGAGDKSAA